MNEKSTIVIIERLKTGLLYKDKIGRLTYNLPDYTSEDYGKIKKQIKNNFKLYPYFIEYSDFDDIFQLFFNGLKRISIEWNHWEGFSVVAKNARAENLVKNIGYFIESKI